MGAYGSTPESGKSDAPTSSASARSSRNRRSGEEVTISASTPPTHFCEKDDEEQYNASGTGFVARTMSSNASPNTPQGSTSSKSNAAAGALPPNDLFWVEKAEVRVAGGGLVAPGHTVKPDVPADKVTPGCEISMCVPKNPTGMNMFKAMRSEWRTRTVRGTGATAAPFSTGMDPDDILDAIEDTPGDMLDPPVHLPYMLDLLADVWEDGGLYD